MFYNRRIESEHRRRTAHPSAGRPHNKKVGERIHGACKRRPHARLISARTIRNRRLWLECLRLRRFSRLVQTTLLADSALTTTSYGDSPYQSFSARAGNPNFIDFAELIRRVSGAARYRWRVSGIRPSNVDYGAIFGGRRQILDRAAERFAADKPADFDDFIQPTRTGSSPTVSS